MAADSSFAAFPAGNQPRRSRRRALGEPVRVAVVDDHPVVREAVRMFLGEHEDIVVVGEGKSGRDAIDLVRDRPVDVMLLDLDMPGHSGIDAIAMIRAKAPHVGVIVLSGYPEAEYALPLIRAGASAFLSKTCEAGDIVAAVRKVASGGSFITTQVADLLTSQLAPRAAQAPHEQLSARELQVFLKLAQGKRPGEVARELCLSSKTISSYRAKVLRKLDSRSNSDLTHYALKHRLLD